MEPQRPHSVARGREEGRSCSLDFTFHGSSLNRHCISRLVGRLEGVLRAYFTMVEGMPAHFVESVIHRGRISLPSVSIQHVQHGSEWFSCGTRGTGRL